MWLCRERTRRAGCPVCRRHSDADDSAVRPATAATPRAGPGPGERGHHLAPAVLSEEEARATLGVPVGASNAEVKAAYRQRVLASHPDKNPSAADGGAAFQQVQAAYALLMQPRPTKH